MPRFALVVVKEKFGKDIQIVSKYYDHDCRK